MRHFYSLLALVASAVMAQAGPINTSYVDITGTTTSSIAVAKSITDISGPILQVHVVLGTATDVDVDVLVDPADANEGTFTLYSADDVTNDTVLFPVFDRNSSAGAALTSDPPGLYYCAGDPITCTVSDWAATGTTVRVKIVWAAE